jgi:hypothetical protein
MFKLRIFERTYPYLFAVAVGIASWYYKVEPSDAKFDGMLTSAISVSAIFLGFIGTAKAMLLSFRSTKFTWMKSNPAVWKLLLGYLKAAFRLSFIVCLASLVLLIFDTAKISAEIKPYIVPVWVFLFSASVITFYRVVTVFFIILASE